MNCLQKIVTKICPRINFIYIYIYEENSHDSATMQLFYLVNTFRRLYYGFFFFYKIKFCNKNRKTL